MENNTGTEITLRTKCPKCGERAEIKSIDGEYIYTCVCGNSGSCYKMDDEFYRKVDYGSLDARTLLKVIGFILLAIVITAIAVFLMYIVIMYITAYFAFGGDFIGKILVSIITILITSVISFFVVKAFKLRKVIKYKE